MTSETDVADPDQTRGPEADEAEDFPEAVVDSVSQFLGKPRARGWIHVYAAAVAAIAGTALVSVSWSLQGFRAGMATLIYTLTIVAMFTVSGTYHRVNWKSPTAHKWMKRLDHSMIFVFIAGSYTPLALLALPEPDGWTPAPAWVGVPLYMLLGWIAVWFVGPIMQGAGVAALVLLIVGGVLYSIGGVFYALKWPNPWPTTFGHHEFFHACTAVAAICHYIAMWFAVFW